MSGSKKQPVDSQMSEINYYSFGFFPHLVTFLVLEPFRCQQDQVVDIDVNLVDIKMVTELQMSPNEEKNLKLQID
jgi:hypothetical protein